MKRTMRTAARKKSAVAKLALWTASILCSLSTHALTFPLPSQGNVVGQVQYASVGPGQGLSTIGRRFDIGGYEMMEANPGVNYTRPRTGTNLVIPSKFVLPDAEREGIVINLAEMRLYFYHPDGKHVSTFPVGIGQDGWETPIGTTTIVRMREKPTWVVPDSILENHERAGKPIPPTMPPGPKNPLGEFAISTGFKNIVIHGTPYPMGVGVRSSHGCIRMLPEDIRALYKMVSVGTKLAVVHQPNKVGFLGNQLYLEVHVPITDELYTGFHNADSLVQRLANKLGKKINVQWSEAQRLKSQSAGYPQVIGNIY